MDKELECVCLNGSTLDEEDGSAVGEKGPSSGNELNVGELYGVEPFSTIVV